MPPYVRTKDHETRESSSWDYIPAGFREDGVVMWMKQFCREVPAVLF